jgi:hypothetical protein
VECAVEVNISKTQSELVLHEIWRFDHMGWDLVLLTVP